MQAMNFLPAVRPPDSSTPLAWCFAFVEGQFLLPDAEPSVLRPESLDALVGMAESRHYLDRLDDVDCWALRLRSAPAGWRPVALRAAMMQFPELLSGIAGRAAQVLEWERAHRFCGVCGTPTVAHDSERSRLCPACRHVAYPRLSPAMMALVWRGDELLLARSPHYAPGMFSALAGFVEAGESLEDCVHREVAEEVGVRVRTLSYYGSQSWPFPHSLMVAFTAEWSSGDIVPQESEIESADWYRIDALPGVPPRFSIAGHLIRDTVERLRRGDD
jgi:NAD+ diphosphatase